MDQLAVGFDLIFQFQNIALIAIGLIPLIPLIAIPGLYVPLALPIALPFT